MVLGNVEETITLVDVNEETYEEVIRVNTYIETSVKSFSTRVFIYFLIVDCKTKL